MRTLSLLSCLRSCAGKADVHCQAEQDQEEDERGLARKTDRHFVDGGRWTDGWCFGMAREWTRRRDGGLMSARSAWSVELKRVRLFDVGLLGRR